MSKSKSKPKAKQAAAPEPTPAPAHVEIFKDIPGFNGYRASNLGRIQSCRNRRGRLTEHWHDLKVTLDKDGRTRVVIPNESGKRQVFLVATLVLLAFVGPKPEGMEACHYPDPDYKNNRLDNLRWGTPTPAPTRQPSSGERHPVMSFRVTPECSALLDEMAEYYEVSKREVIDRALREFYRGEFAATRAKARAGR